MLATGLFVAYGYMMETFMAWYSGNPLRDVHDLRTASSGPYAPLYWTLIFCNVDLDRRRCGSSACGRACRRCS